jgi:hypothetical protein
MIRAFSLSSGLALLITIVAADARAQVAPAPGTAPPPGAPATAPPVAAVPPTYGPPMQGDPNQGYGPPPGYAAGWRAQPLEMKYVEGRPIPAGYHLETRARRGLVVSGPIIFGVPYLLSMSVAASSHYQPDRWLYAPVVGPFVNLATRADDCDPNNSSGSSNVTVCSGDSGIRFFLMLDGLMQTAGATLLVLGLALPQHLLVRDDAPFTGANKSNFAWAISPYAIGRSGYGVGINGIF